MLYYIVILGVFFPSIEQTDTLRNNGSFMFPIHSFSFCSLIILATTSSSAQEFPEFQKESGLGMVDYRAVTEAVKSSSKKSNRKESYTHWSNKERFTIGKYAAENGDAATARKFSSKEKTLNDSTVRRFC